jgi:hypothetical protein
MIPLRLTSHFLRGEAEADELAFDDQGQDWQRQEDQCDPEITDQDAPIWPECVVCGKGVDVLHDSHCWHGRHPEEDLYLHNTPECSVLVYPGEKERAS